MSREDSENSSERERACFALQTAGFPKRYRVIKELGQGGVAMTFEVEHQATGERRVAKVLSRWQEFELEAFNRLKLEAQALRRLRHPNIVEILDWGQLEGGQPFLVMERLEGHTIGSELQLRQRVTIQEALTWTSQLLSALASTHSEGLLHRDIAPENLFLHRTAGLRQLKLCDFGFTKVTNAATLRFTVEHSTDELVIVGSPYFASPEAVRAERQDQRSDLYQVGLVLHTMLTGFIPYSEMGDVMSVLTARLHQPLLPVSQLRGEPIPEELEALLRRALAPQAKDRFSCAQEFQGVLSTIMQAEKRETVSMSADLEPAIVQWLQSVAVSSDSEDEK